jgi:hypothetical protein
VENIAERFSKNRFYLLKQGFSVIILEPLRFYKEIDIFCLAGMTIEQPVILNVGPEEFSLGLTYTGSSRTREFTNLAFDPMPSYNRIIKIFSRPTFKEKEAEVKRWDRDIISREAEAEAALLEGQEVEGLERKLEDMEVDGQEDLEVRLQLASETMDLEEEAMSSQLSQLSVQSEP